jgi:hypothetical protein
MSANTDNNQKTQNAIKNKYKRLSRVSPNFVEQIPVKSDQDSEKIGVMSNEDLRGEVRELARNVELVLRELTPLKTLTELKISLADATEKLIKIGEENRVLTERVNAQAQTIEELNSRMNDLEQYSRRDCVEILGIDENPGENCENLVLGLARASGIEIDQTDISIAHRVPNIGGGKRKIMAKFVSTGIRNRLFGAGRVSRSTVSKLNGELRNMDIPQLVVNEGRQKIFINECLTRANRGVFVRALTLKKELNLWHAWTVDGVTRIRVVKDGPVMKFRSVCELELFETNIKSKSNVLTR